MDFYGNSSDLFVFLGRRLVGMHRCLSVGRISLVLRIAHLEQLKIQKNHSTNNYFVEAILFAYHFR